MNALITLVFITWGIALLLFIGASKASNGDEQ